MKINKESIFLSLKDEALSFRLSNNKKGLSYVLTKAWELLEFDFKQVAVTQKWQIEPSNMDLGKSLFLHISPCDQFAAICNTCGQYGVVYDLVYCEKILSLDRGKYHTEQTVFPLLFFTKNGKSYLAYATDWNHINIFDLRERKNVTERENKYGGNFYLDYFYGELHLSPSGKWLLSSGWVWNPVSCCKFIDLDAWMTSNIQEPEKVRPCDFGILSYYWDRAICWLSENSVAYLYDTREEGLDKEERAEMGLEQAGGYILVYDISKEEITSRIAFEDFPRDEHHEANRDCKIFHYHGYFIISSKKMGTSIVEVGTGLVVYQDNSIYLADFNEKQNRFYTLNKNKKLELFEIKMTS